MITRIFTGIIGISIIAIMIQQGGRVFAGMALILAFIAWHELSDLLERRRIHLTYVFGFIAITGILGIAYMSSATHLFSSITFSTMILPAMLAISFWILILTLIFYQLVNPPDALASIGGIFYIGFPFAFLILLRGMGSDLIETPLDQYGIHLQLGSALVWMMFLGTWASDTFAYFVGTAFGSHRLAPSISPKKSVEGFLGGVLGTVATTSLVGNLIFHFPAIEMAVFGFGIAIAATIGDLVESVIKRFAGMKDSGDIIPGHGGVLDRFDSLLFTAPAAYYFFIYIFTIGEF